MAGDAERLFQLLNDIDCKKSLLKRVLTKDIFDELKFKKTALGGTLGDCIRPGCEHPYDTLIGVRICDPEGYRTFALLIDKLIKEYHATDHIRHPPVDFGNPDDVDLNFDDVDPNCVFIKSTRVRVGRSLVGFGFHPVMSLQDRLDVEAKICQALNQLQGELEGEYLRLGKLSRETQNELVREHLLYNDHNKILKSIGGYKDWSLGRGIYLNQSKTFVVWVGEEDHIRVISMQSGNDLQGVFNRLVKGLRSLEDSGLNWLREERLGYVTFCPTNLGTTLRASVHLQLPRLSGSAHLLEFCAKRNLQVRGLDGDGSPLSGTVLDISNKRRLGLTEIEAVREMQKGVKAVIMEEKRLQQEFTPPATSTDH